MHSVPHLDYLEYFGAKNMSSVEVSFSHLSGYYSYASLNDGIRCEKCVVRRFRRYAKVYLHKPR
jgi:hypothetical protein